LAVNKWGLFPEQARALEDLEKVLGKTIEKVEFPLTERIIGVEQQQKIKALFEESTESDARVYIESSNVIELNLMKCDLGKLPESIGNLQYLQKLKLNNNVLSSLPESFGNLKSLQVLYLRDNNLISLPKSFKNLRSLEVLGLMNNKLRAIPKDLLSLPLLKFLGVSGNPIDYSTDDTIKKLIKTGVEILEISGKMLITKKEAAVIEELEQLTGKLLPLMMDIDWITYGVNVEDEHVVGLSLCDSKLETLPESISNLTHLKELDISNNMITSLPNTFSELDKLQKLNYNLNRLEAVNPQLFNLKSLIELDLSNNWLKFFPALERQNNSLQKLNLESNYLMTLPESFDKLKNLRELDISGNKMLVLPESFGNLRNLQILNMSHNRLVDLPESFGNLKSLKIIRLISNQFRIIPNFLSNLEALNVLALSENYIKSLPESIGKLKSLQQLSLHRNQLTILPNSVCELEALESLDLSNNFLQSLPESFGNLTSLQSLTLDQNWLTQLPDSFPKLKSLNFLRLVNNEISTLPAAFGELKSLETLDLRGNPINLLPKSFGQLESLSELNILGLPLTKLPESFKNLVNLKTLFISPSIFDLVPKSLLEGPLLVTHEPPIEAGPPRREAKKKLLERYGDINADQEIELEKEAEITVQIRCKAADVEGISVKMEIEKPEKGLPQIEIYLIALPELFEIPYPKQTLSIPLDKDSDLLKFPIIPHMLGTHHLSVEFCQAGKWIGHAVLEIIVKEKVTQTKKILKPYDFRTTQNPEDALTLRIYRQGNRFIFFMPPKDPSMSESEEKSIHFVTIEDEQLTKLEKELKVASLDLKNPQESYKKIYQIGNIIYQIIPKSLRDAIQKRNPKYLNIVTGDLFIPFELAHDGEDFLCIKYCLGKNLIDEGQDITTPPSCFGGIGAESFDFVLIESDPYKNLNLQETQLIPALFGGMSGVFYGFTFDYIFIERPIANKKMFQNLFKRYLEIIHFCGHGFFNNEQPELSGLILTDGVLTAQEIQEMKIQGFPLVFANSCESASIKKSERAIGINGVARAFLTAGAIGFIGPIWEITDALAAEFAEVFYNKLIIEKMTVGEAIRETKIELRKKYHYILWASFSFFGDPTLRICPHIAKMLKAVDLGDMDAL